MAQTPHLYIPQPWEGGLLEIDEAQRHHLNRVLRLAPGGPVTYTDGAGTFGQGRLGGSGVERGDEHSVGRHANVSVAVAPPGSRSRCRFLVEKLAELGVAQLWWVTTRRTEGRPPPGEKARAWVVAALEQSRGAWLMKTGDCSLEHLDSERVIVADPGGGPMPIPPGSVLLVGPEGGFEADEIRHDWRRMSLGPNILRVETAAIAATVLATVRRGEAPYG